MQDSIIRALSEELKFKDFELNALLEITKGINSDQSLDYLLSVYEFILKEQLGLQKFVLYKKQTNWTHLIKTGVKGRIKDIDIERDLLRFDKITLIESSSNLELNQFDVVIPVFHQEKALAFLLLSEKNINGKEYNFSSSISELSFIETLTNIIVVAIENKRMNKQGLIQERINKELEVASEMQKLLFPDNLPSDKRLDLAATYTARHEVGGDYYDFIRINEDEFIICIADVSGKGVGAAMLMANFQATIRTLLSFEKFDLEYLIHELNGKVMKAAKGEKFITFFIGKYNSKTRLLQYVNAGHNHPILTNGKKAEFLDKGSIGLGMLDEIPFIEPDEIEIKPNSTLILYTDGIVELQNKAGEYFQADRLIKLIHSFYPLKMEDLNNLIFSKLDEFRETEELVDDTAIFSCRIF
ncbi:PP2C family protein-serine/threonine phosphatase [Brumimicrobium mesophilum]|uniref:PP2C family protein-serine/threonine phosphatase n=1 Tax=Brumimicrobium mesophilum TaxID=392717 RepID=UPI000D140E2E|nr:PP2C family protein-serine/threonine phosphatase [Brumimicrobium mesophilum]